MISDVCINMRSLPYLSLNRLKLLSDILQKILEILLLCIELLELTLNSAVLTLMMCEVSFSK